MGILNVSKAFRLISYLLAIGLISPQYSRDIPLQRADIHHCGDLDDFTFLSSNFLSVKIMNLPSGMDFKTLPCQCILGKSDIQAFSQLLRCHVFNARN